MVSFLQTAKAVHALEPSTHWIHEATLAKRLGISIDDLDGWTKCVREGGSSAVLNNTFTANPETYNAIIDLLDLSADNTFNLNYQVKRCSPFPRQTELLSCFVLPNTTSLVRRRVVFNLAFGAKVPWLCSLAATDFSDDYRHIKQHLEANNSLFNYLLITDVLLLFYIDI